LSEIERASFDHRDRNNSLLHNGINVSIENVRGGPNVRIGADAAALADEPIDPGACAHLSNTTVTIRFLGLDILPVGTDPHTVIGAGSASPHLPNFSEAPSIRTPRLPSRFADHRGVYVALHGRRSAAREVNLLPARKHLMPRALSNA
jgi:hypothetical protein